MGRFEIPLTTQDQAVVQVRRGGYQTRLASFGVTEGQATDVVVLLKPGEDIRGYNHTLRDLQQRLSLKPFRSFVAGREQLGKDGKGADIGNSLRVAMGIPPRCTTESILGPAVPRFE